MKTMTIEIKKKMTPELKTFYYLYTDGTFRCLFGTYEQAQEHVERLTTAFNSGELDEEVIFSKTVGVIE